MKSLLLLLTFFTAPAHAIPMKVFYEGNFRGTRIMLPCGLGTPDGYCFLDTAGSVSIFRDLPAGAYLGGKASLGGIGWQAECRNALLPTVEIGGNTLQNFEFNHCPTFTEFFSPMLGANALWGRRFDFDFSTNEFRWRAAAIAEPSAYVWMAGTRNAWMAMIGSLGNRDFTLVWDTGAPSTLVTHDFVVGQPELFELETERKLSPNTARAGGLAYRIKAPIRVGGVDLQGTYVHAVDLKATFGEGVAGIPMILGTDHIRRANWSFDLDAGTVKVTPIAEPAPAAESR